MENCKTLNEIDKELGVTRRAIQGYEQAGLVMRCGSNKYGHLLYDEKAQEMIRSYNDKRRDAAVKMQYSELSDEEMDALRKEISEAYDELMSYDVISNFVEAQAQLEELNNQVMSVLGEITGAGGCGSGGCSSCSGCH